MKKRAIIPSELEAKSFFAIQSKIRHFESLNLSVIIMKLLNWNSSERLIREYFYRVFGASNAQEVKIILNTNRKRIRIFPPSIKRSIFVGLAIRINIASGKPLRGFDALIYLLLTRFVPLENRILASRLPDVRKLFLDNDKLKLSSQYDNFLRKYSLRKISFTKLFEVDSDYFINSKGIIFDYKGNLHINDPSVNPRSITNAGLHGLLVRTIAGDDFGYYHESKNKVTRLASSPILFLGSRCSENYWHFLLEDASRLLRFKMTNSNLKIHGVILPSNATPVAREIVQLIYRGIQIIEISEYEFVRGERILFPQGVLKLDDEPRLGVHNTFSYEKIDLRNLRDRFITKSKAKSDKFGKRIYVKRNSRHRFIEGEERLITNLVSKDFTIIDLSLYSFQEQVQIFQNAEILIGAAGAAWANLIFAQKSVRVLSLIGEDAAPWDMHKVIAEDFAVDYHQKILKHSKSKELFYENYLHRNVKISDLEIREVLAWIDSQDSPTPKKD